jgi:hypothetical protein
MIMSFILLPSPFVRNLCKHGIQGAETLNTGLLGEYGVQSCVILSLAPSLVEFITGCQASTTFFYFYLNHHLANRPPFSRQLL